MLKKQLIFIPYQDSDLYYSSGIMTREYAILYILYQLGFEKIINIKKPRTILDRKNYIVNNTFFPENSIENKIKMILDKSISVQYTPIFKFEQIFKRRAWWVNAYTKTTDQIKQIDEYSTLVYSNNPYASNLLKTLKDDGVKLYFDIMDNFAIHPSLSAQEKATALKSYKHILSFADIISANSVQTLSLIHI